MSYLLKENLTGNPAKFETKLHISETEKDYVFFFEAKDSTFYCPYKGYNENHFEGDVCEVFIGNADTPREYYEIEITPDGAMDYVGIRCCGCYSDSTSQEADCLIIASYLPPISIGTSSGPHRNLIGT